MDNKFLKYENFIYDLEEEIEDDYVEEIENDNIEDDYVEEIENDYVEEIENDNIDDVEPIFENYRVKVEVRKLNIRVAPGLNEIMIKKKLYKDQIVEIIYEQDGWGELKDGGWIKLEFTKKY